MTSQDMSELDMVLFYLHLKKLWHGSMGIL